MSDFEKCFFKKSLSDVQGAAGLAVYQHEMTGINQTLFLRHVS